jgi:hypothetical protein
MNMTAAEARAEGAFLRGPAALLAESGGVGGQVEGPGVDESEVRRCWSGLHCNQFFLFLLALN